ncbi:hypothetical protein [Shimia sagamensis]|uniref:Uncharacterized protein n=1 Tax=Shimia sagamensis TaxID=1566352 RepID=A0ABY1PJD7_9RHOB|nr:hypothetical protein [Shimia sagamensis]SMP33754.1 hypothetical protein SAMN06265373_109126 [Shimia sagamensis]
MDLPNYKKLPPVNGESNVDYCRRLDAAGHDELFLRTALAFHFHLPKTALKRCLDQFPEARLRHITRLAKLHPTRSACALADKLARNLDMSVSEARNWALAHDGGRFGSQQFHRTPTHGTAAKLQ